MKTRTATFMVALAMVCTTATANVAPNFDNDDPKAQLTELRVAQKAALTEAQWGHFSKTLVEALHTQHDGLNEAAMRLIIQYGDQLDVNAGVYDVMRIYRDHEDVSMRRMAVVALGQMNNRWAIRFLQRSTQFEKSPNVKKTIKAVVADYYAQS
jgi:hypothetical protein